MNQKTEDKPKDEGREVACRGDAKMGTACGKCWRCQERGVRNERPD